MDFIQDQPKGSENEKVKALESLYKTADNARRRFEPEWYENILFLAGNQWEYAHDDVRRFSRRIIHVPDTKVKLTSNQIYPLFRQAVSTLRNNIASQEAVPSTSDPSDREAADLASDFIQARYYEDEEEEQRLREIEWSMCTGRCMRMTYWDPDKDGMGAYGKIPKAGDISSTTLNPFKFYVCPWMDDELQFPWIIISDVRDIDEINDIYPGHDVQAEEYAEAMRVLDKIAMNIVESRTMDTAPKRNGAAILKRIYIKPNYEYPNGKTFTWCNGKLLQEGELPDGIMPFVDIRWFPIPGRLYPLPFVSPLRGLQREINIALSQLIELKNRQLRGDIIVKGKKEPTVNYMESGAKIIHLDHEIEQFLLMEYNLNPNETESIIAHMFNDMMQTSGIHEPSLGKAFPRETTATQTAILKESDMSGLTIFRAGYDQSYCKVSQHKILIAKNHYIIPRMIKVVGQYNQVKARSFFGSELRNTEDVRPRTIPMLTETMKSQIRNDAYAQGLFGPYASPEDMFAKLTALKNTGIEGITEEIDNMIAPLTYDELRNIVGQINIKKIEATLLATDMQLQQLVAQIQQTQAQQQGQGQQQAQGQEQAQQVPQEEGAELGNIPQEQAAIQ